MYDPNAPQMHPQPGQMQTMQALQQLGAPMPPQQMPPQHMGGHFHPVNALLPPVMQPGGGNAPPPVPGGPPIGGDPRYQAHTDFMNAVHDWRDLRPARQGFDGTKQDWRSQMMDWRQQRPDPHGYGFGGGQPNMLFPPAPATPIGGPVMQGGPIPGQPAPVVPNTQFPLNPAVQPGMVGQSLTVQGMTPATNPFGLPGY